MISQFFRPLTRAYEREKPRSDHSDCTIFSYELETRDFEMAGRKVLQSSAILEEAKRLRLLDRELPIRTRPLRLGNNMTKKFKRELKNLRE